MFYSYDLLCQRAGGKFSLVWLAATHKRLPANDYVRINIVKTCEDIMEVVKNQEPRIATKSARSRFSLYLSSMLLYGTCIVFKQQVILTIDCMMNLYHLTVTCNGTKRNLEASRDGEENDAGSPKRGRKKKKQQQLEPVDEKFLAELTVPLKAPPGGIVLSPRLSPTTRPARVALPPDVMQSLKVPHMIIDDKEPDAPMDQMCEELTKYFENEGLLLEVNDVRPQESKDENQLPATVPVSQVPGALTEQSGNLDVVPQTESALAQVENTDLKSIQNTDLRENKLESCGDVQPGTSVAAPENKLESCDDVQPGTSVSVPENKLESYEVVPHGPSAVDGNANNIADAAPASFQLPQAPVSDQVPSVVCEIKDPVTETTETLTKTATESLKPETPAPRTTRRRTSAADNNLEQHQEHLQKRKRRRVLICEDEEVEIPKNTLRNLIGKDDLELRNLAIEREIKSCFTAQNTLFLIENPCCIDMHESCQTLITAVFKMNTEQLQKQQQRHSSLEGTVEIERGQRTPTPPQSPLDSLRDRSSLLHHEVSDTIPRLQPIIETNLEELDFPGKEDAVMPDIPLPEIPEVEISHTSLTRKPGEDGEENILLQLSPPKVELDANKNNVESPVPESETLQLKESDVIMQPPAEAICDVEMINVEKAHHYVSESHTEECIPPFSEKVSKSIQETENILNRVQTLQNSLNRIVSVSDLCPVQTTTKYKAAVTLKCLLELDFRKKVILQQDRSISFGPIYISVV